MAVTRSKRGGRAATRLAVLGGGVSGLAAAFYARRAYPDAEVVLLEASERFGGTVRTAAKDGFVLDLGPDALLTRKPAGLELCRSLGLERRLVARSPEGRAVYMRRNGALRRLPASMRMFVPLGESELRASGLLSEAGASRVFRGPDTAATGRGRLSGRNDEDDESIEAFFSRHFGAEMYRYLAEPLTAGILGGDGCRLELNSGVGGIAHGGRAQSANTGSGAATAGRPRWRVQCAGGGSVEADAVICALPAYAASQVISSIDSGLAELLAATTYSRAAAVFVALPTEAVGAGLAGSGYLVPRGEGGLVTACTWSSRKWPGRAPQGYELLRVFMAPAVAAGGDISADGAGRSDSGALDGLSDRQLVETALAELRQALGAHGEPRLAEVWRWDYGVANYSLGHLERRAEIERRLQEQPGLVLAGSALYGVGIPDCIRSAREAVDRLAGAAAGAGTAI